MSFVKSFRILSLGALLVAGGLPAFAGDLAGPSLSLGVVSPWAVLTYGEPRVAVGAATNYTQTVDFSLNSASMLRVDIRSVESYQTRIVPTYNSFSSASFKVFDAAHQLVGTSAVDGSFAQSSCFDRFSCTYNRGLTFTSALEAGKYTVEFTGVVSGQSVPALTYGAALGGANVAAYLAAVTPAGAVTAPVPEPATALLMGLGLGGLVFSVRSARRAGAQA